MPWRVAPPNPSVPRDKGWGEGSRVMLGAALERKYAPLVDLWGAQLQAELFWQQEG